MTHGNRNNGWGGGLMSPAGLAAMGFLGVAGYFLWTEHQAHVVTFLPWLLIAACPLMHLFMHGGHGHGGGHGRRGHGAGDDAGSQTKSLPHIRDGKDDAE